jgi:hypothetical protein
MPFTLETLEELLPAAIAWARAQEAMMLEKGVPLDEWEREAARHLGVAEPERVRLLPVKQVPLPADYALCAAAQRLGLVSEQSLGMALGYGIFVRQDFWRQREIVAHELVHTAQCDRLGGLEPFLRQYLTECFLHGYAAAPLEMEAVRRSGEHLKG